MKRARSQRSKGSEGPPGVGGQRLFRTHPICERGSGQSWSQIPDENKSGFSELSEKQLQNESASPFPGSHILLKEKEGNERVKA